MFAAYFKSLLAGLKSFGAFLGLLAVVLAFIFWRVDYKTNVEIFWFIAIITFLLCLLYIFICASIINFRAVQEQLKTARQLPKIININKPDDNKCVLIYATTSVFFSKGIDVSFCLLDNLGAESVFCYGYVAHVQEKLIQIEVREGNHDFKNLSQLYTEMLKHDKDMYLVKPGKVII